MKEKHSTSTLIIGSLLIAVLFAVIGFKIGTSDAGLRHMLMKKYSALLLAPIVNSHNADLFFSYDRAALLGWKEDQTAKSAFVFKSSDMSYSPETAQLAEGSYINVSNNTLVDENKFKNAVSELAKNAGADESDFESLQLDGHEAVGYKHTFRSGATGYTYHVASGGLLWSISMISADNDMFERDLPAFKNFASSFDFK